MERKTQKRVKSMLSLMLSLVMTLSVVLLSVPVSSASFTFADVESGDWFYENVNYVYENGIMKGISNEKFAPRETMSRAMSATILYRMAGEPDVSGISHPFTDVPTGTWYSDAVAFAYDSEIVNGKSDTSFAPDDEISRAEFATMFWRYTEFAELALPAKRTGNIADETAIPFYARSAVKNMYRAEVINGQTGYKFEPHAKITRCEAAAIIERFIKNAVPADSIVEPDIPEYDPELYLDIAFIGNSFTLYGSTASHFDAIGGDRLIQVRDYSKTMYGLSNHINWFTSESGKDQLEELQEKADIVVFQELGGSFPYEQDAETLMDMIGRDKKYYAVLPFTGPSVNNDNTDGIYLPGDTGNNNEVFADLKDYYLKEHNIELIYISNVVDFDPSLGLKESDFLIKNDYHPNSLFGYAIALGVYCAMFDENATEQNDGDLSLYIVPGETEAEKYEFIALLKNTVQRIIDYQNK